jgi:putative restriction endonuclease
MWAPKQNDKGHVAAGWLTMTQVQPGDIIFSFADTYVKQVGIALSAAYDSAQPVDFKNRGQLWNIDGWKVDVLYVPLDTPFQPRNHMGALLPLLPEKYSPLQPSGRGNQAYLFPVPELMASQLLQLAQVELPDMPVLHLKEIDFNHDEQDIIVQENLRETEKVALVLSRRGQGLFRSRVRSIEDSCRVTGLSAEGFLIASHIKPWKQSDNAERVDGNNGLFLSPHIDKLFDNGYISFTKKGEMLVSPQLPNEVLEKWAVKPQLNYGKFNGDQAYFLEFHNEQQFKSSAA